MDPQVTSEIIEDIQTVAQEPTTTGLRAAEKRPLDWVSVALSVIAALLIVVGIYFLQQSVATTNTLTRSSSSVSSSSLALSASSPVVSSEVSSSSSISIVSSSSESSSLSSSVESEVSSSSVAVVPPPAFDPVNDPFKIGSTNAEITIQVTSSGGGLVGGTVINTGFTGTRWFNRPGITWGAFDATPFNPVAQIGDVWRLELSITADQTNGAIGLPGALTVVKAYKL